MPRFYIEDLRDYYLNLFQNQLDAKLAAITAERADDVELDTFEAEQYTNTLNEKVMNYESFIFYGFPVIDSVNNAGGCETPQRITMSVAVVFCNPEDGRLAETQIMRYTRALSEVAAESALENPVISGLVIDEFAPLDMSDNMGSTNMKYGGITITGTIA